LQTDGTNLQYTNEFYYTLNGLILYWVISELQHQIQQGFIGVQVRALKLKQPNLG